MLYRYSSVLRYFKVLRAHNLINEYMKKKLSTQTSKEEGNRSLLSKPPRRIYNTFSATRITIWGLCITDARLTDARLTTWMRLIPTSTRYHIEKYVPGVVIYRAGNTHWNHHDPNLMNESSHKWYMTHYAGIFCSIPSTFSIICD